MKATKHRGQDKRIAPFSSFPFCNSLLFNEKCLVFSTIIIAGSSDWLNTDCRRSLLGLDTLLQDISVFADLYRSRWIYLLL